MMTNNTDNMQMQNNVYQHNPNESPQDIKRKLIKYRFYSTIWNKWCAEEPKDNCLEYWRDIHRRVNNYEFDEIFSDIDKKNNENNVKIFHIKREIKELNRSYSCMLWTDWLEGEEYAEDPVVYWQNILDRAKNGGKEKWSIWDDETDANS
jgi:hypothetical protein